MTDYFPNIPDDDDELVTMNVDVVIVAPKTLLGWIGMRFFTLANWCGVEPVLQPRSSKSMQFGQLPQAVRDKMVADMLTGEFVTGMRVRDITDKPDTGEGNA